MRIKYKEKFGCRYISNRTGLGNCSDYVTTITSTIHGRGFNSGSGRYETT